MPSSTAVSVSCALSDRIMRRSCCTENPSARSSPSSRVRCSTLSERLLTRPTAAMMPLNPIRIEKIGHHRVEHLLDALDGLGLLRLRGQDHLLPGRHRHPEGHEQGDADHEPDRRAGAALRMAERVLGGQARRGRAPQHPADQAQRGRHDQVGREHDAGERQDAADQSDEHADRVREADEDAERPADRTR